MKIRNKRKKQSNNLQVKQIEGTNTVPISFNNSSILNSNLLYRRKNRNSQLGTISDMIQLQKLNDYKPMNVFKCHFKKHKNKIEKNRNLDQAIEQNESKIQKLKKNNIIKGNKEQIQRYSSSQLKTPQVQQFRNKQRSSFKSLHKKNNFRQTLYPQSRQKQTGRKNTNKLYARRSQSNKQNHCNSRLNERYQIPNRLKISKEYSMEKINQLKIYPIFKTLQLLALYRSLLQYSDNDPSKFLRGFESALSFQRIILKPELIKKKLWQHKVLNFKHFLETYKNLEEMVFIQSIIDFIQIIFEPYIQSKMNIQEVMIVFQKRSTFNNSKHITELIYKKLRKQKYDLINLSEIIQLCQTDFQFCSMLPRLCSQEIRKNPLGANDIHDF